MKISLALTLLTTLTKTAASQNCFLCGEDVEVAKLNKDKLFYDYYIADMNRNLDPNLLWEGTYPTCEYMDNWVKSLSTQECANFPPPDVRVDIQSWCGCPGAKPKCFLCGEDVELPEPDKVFFDYYTGGMFGELAYLPMIEEDGVYTCGDVDNYLRHMASTEEKCAQIPPQGARVDIRSFCGCPGAEAPNVCKVCDGDGTKLADPNQNAKDNMWDWDGAPANVTTCGWLSDYAASMVNESLGWCKENILFDGIESVSPEELPPSFPKNFVPITKACCVPASTVTPAPTPAGSTPGPTVLGGDKSGGHQVLLQNTRGLIAFALTTLIFLLEW